VCVCVCVFVGNVVANRQRCSSLVSTDISLYKVSVTKDRSLLTENPSHLTQFSALYHKEKRTTWVSTALSIQGLMWQKIRLFLRNIYLIWRNLWLCCRKWSCQSSKTPLSGIYREKRPIFRPERDLSFVTFRQMRCVFRQKRPIFRPEALYRNLCLYRGKIICL